MIFLIFVYIVGAIATFTIISVKTAESEEGSSEWDSHFFGAFIGLVCALSWPVLALVAAVVAILVGASKGSVALHNKLFKR